MWEVVTLMTLKEISMTWKSASSNGWEYFGCV